MQGKDKIELENAICTEGLGPSTIISKKVKLRSTIMMPGCELQLKSRGVKLLVVDQEMFESILRRNIYENIQFFHGVYNICTKRIRWNDRG